MNTDKRKTTAKAVNALIAAIALIAGMLTTTGCSLEDERDLCCQKTTLHYRYIRQESDEYKAVIKNIRHLLFDDNDRFVREIQNPTAKQDITLEGLKVGTYKVLTIANADTDTVSITTPLVGRTTLSEMTLALKNRNTAGDYGNTNELFWNTREVELTANKSRRYICDLSNIHCHLSVRVRWYTVPKFTGDYTIMLKGAAKAYELTPALADTLIIREAEAGQAGESTEQRVVHTFPKQQSDTLTHALTVPLHNLELQAEFITLRYTDEKMPILQVTYGQEAVTKEIDLSKAFIQWNWYPDSHPEQIYKIDITIYDDGKVVLNQWAEATVMDWVDGGSVGTIKK